jgi:hypothetical protein
VLCVKTHLYLLKRPGCSGLVGACVQVTLDAELGVSAGHHGGQVDVTAVNVTCPRESFHSFTYSRVSRGLMVDVSWNGSRRASTW